MPTLPLTDIFDHPRDLGFNIRVREMTFLWGSNTIAANMTFPQPIIMHVRNYLHGDTVTLGTWDASGKGTALGSLAGGQCLTVAIQNVTGVYAQCAAGTESVVGCVIK